MQKIICRLDWIARSSIEKSANASAWAPPPVNLYSGKDPIVQTAPVQPHVPVNNKPSIEQAAGISLKKEIETLRAENLRLRSNLQKSETRRREIEIKLNHKEIKRGLKECWLELMNSKWTKALKAFDDEGAGLLFNLSEEIELLSALDKELAVINHASRDGVEPPIAIVSENELQVVSYPKNENVGDLLMKFNETMMDKNNMIGHMVVSHNKVEVTANFAGVKGNLVWGNTGDTPLVLGLRTDGRTKSILLGPGFGFCIGKRERFLRVFLSSLDVANDLFNNTEMGQHRSHAMFFGCDGGDNGNWRGVLNSKKYAQEYRGHFDLNKSHIVNANDRYARLGVQVMNNKRNIIRIAPMRGSNFPEGLLSKKIDVVKGWIKNTLGQAKLNPLPNDFSVFQSLERPHIGDAFEVLHVKFDFDENMWSDEVMWDIRCLLMGSKMDKLPGFPSELRNVRDKLYISRDGISERKRRRRLD